MAFGERLQQILKEKKISQKKFAEEIEEPTESVNRYIKGTRIPRGEFFLKLFKYFPDVDLNWLFQDETETKGIVSDVNLRYDKPTGAEEAIKNIEENLEKLKRLLPQK